MRCHILAQGAVMAAFLGGVCAQLDSLSPCGVACVNNVIAKGFGCASGDNTCLCKQQDFIFGVRDCVAQSCTADESTKANDYIAGLCATATRAPPASTPPPSTPATQQSTAPKAQPPPPASTTAPAQASEARTLIESAPHSSAPLEATRKPITEVAQATQLPTITPTTLSASVRPQSSITTSSTPTPAGARPSQSASAPDAGAENQTSEALSLSTPAMVGIGVGAGVGTIAVGVALWLLIRRPKTQLRSMQISGPMPGSGRDYTGGIIGIKERNHSELDARSKRYEDMVPRQSPRRVI